MDAETVKTVANSSRYILVKHSGNKELYRFDMLVKLKICGGWVDACVYSSVKSSGTYCREISNFLKFSVN